MKDVRVDADGEFRCWNCGNKGLIAKRTLRSKVLVGVGALLTKKKLKCQTCGEYNDTGNAKPYTGPESRKWRKHYEAEQKKKSAATLASEAKAAADATALVLAEIASNPAIEASAPPPPPPDAPPPPAIPASWTPDPTGRHELRYWDGLAWTEHVSDAGVQSTDAP